MKTLRTIADLAEAQLLAPGEAVARVAERYAVAITPAMAELIRDPDDPIARQFLPDPRELDATPGENADPIGDKRHSPVAGVVHRYKDRVLLKVVQVCPVYCRFCFRREKVGEEGTLPEADLQAALDYLHATPAVREVILTGGDPLVLSPRRLGDLMARLSAVPHLEVIRLHSRVPVVAPDRIPPALLAALEVPQAVWLVVHTNHADELTPASCAALRRLLPAAPGRRALRRPPRGRCTLCRRIAYVTGCKYCWLPRCAVCHGIVGSAAFGADLPPKFWRIATKVHSSPPNRGWSEGMPQRTIKGLLSQQSE